MATEAQPARSGATSEGPAPSAGTITLITGCMFSGKTSMLLTELAERPPGTCRAFKHACNDRYAAEAIVSHNGRTQPAAKVRSATEILDRLDDRITVVGLDDAHFFDDRLMQVAEALARKGVGVMVTALNLDSWGRTFDCIEAVAAVAHKRVRTQGLCTRCGAEATHTQRTAPIRNGSLVGGAEAYEPRCAGCWRPPPEPPPIG